MSIKAIITEEYTIFNGTLVEKLTGLSLYIQALRKTTYQTEEKAKRVLNDILVKIKLKAGDTFTMPED